MKIRFSMIFAVTQGLERYDIMCAGVQAGLYSTYFGRSPVLFNLITRTSLIPFQFEAGSTVTEPFYLIDNDHLYEQTLPQKVGGRTVDRLCCELSPLEMLEFFEARRDELPGLAVTEYWYNNVDLLLDVMKARVIAWKSFQRGQIGRKENGLILAQFGPLLTEAERDFVLSMNPYHKDFREPKNGRVPTEPQEVSG
ncbi:MAG TPA: hypothetical protein ENN79_10935 [Desulfobacteraceae bacterium]|nr:hypothetical protein [Desulfobacteraceae bacterium]